MLALTDPYYVCINWFNTPRSPLNTWLVPTTLTGARAPVLVAQTQDIYELQSAELANVLCGSLATQFQGIAAVVFITAIPIVVNKRP